MTRIIAGTAKGRRLKTPAGERTRPTSDRVREAMFAAFASRLGSLAGLRFLDLYAGSGAVGLEALSRGAAAATLVEADRRTVLLVRENAQTLGFSNAEVVAGKVEKTLARPPSTAYDVVFLDPPYPLGEDALEQVLGLLVEHAWLAVGGVLVVERSKRSAEPEWPAGIEAERERRYGESVLWWAVRSRPNSTG